ncbi:DNA mismatch repair protein Mlh1 [Halyomorpha halys]|uniref:DNA mismatch repair protein Mlh1 n=1 Tax=Halyomorpha halys TaxID=286706 RepID=UPI0006D51369
MAEPGVIKKLDETVVNRIAAGEVIQRPANALKELLENSLDAKSSNIKVTLKGGGLKLLQIQDDGTGIRKEDLDIVCERFTTSKLREFEDLNSINTFGFRGEALASISHIAHLTITTKTASQQCAYTVSYEDGKPKGAPKPCAGNQGTIISVEDLFYNVATRRKAFKSPSEEHSRVADVLGRYAIHNPKVGFALKKHEANTSDIKTNPNSTHVDNIRSIYGNSVARELLEVEGSDDSLKYKMHGLISNVNYSAKKSIFILFINDRLVDSTALRKTIENVYSLYLAKGSHPFVYISLALDPRNVDVNVHPTKHEVHFLHEDIIIDKTQKSIEAKLLGSNTSRVFYKQCKLPNVDLNLTTAVLEDEVEKEKEKEKTIRAKNMVRTDAASQKIDKFLKTDTNSSSNDTSRTEENNHKRREIKLTSVLTLKSNVENECNLAVRDIVANITYVGCIDPNSVLVQHSTNLYLFRLKILIEELFFQTMLYDFGNFGAIKFKSGLSLYDLAMLGLEDPESKWKEEDGKKEMLAETVSQVLVTKAEMLSDYFSIEIDNEKRLLSIPLLLDKYMPDITRLPNYILRLACDVDWKEEKACFEGICRETAKFYCYVDTLNEYEGHNWKWTLEHILVPALKKTLLPPKHFAEDGTMLLLTSLPDLYKVFERC